MNRYLNNIDCKSYDKNTNRLKKFQIIKYSFNYENNEDKNFLNEM